MNQSFLALKWLFFLQLLAEIVIFEIKMGFLEKNSQFDIKNVTHVK